MRRLFNATPGQIVNVSTSDTLLHTLQQEKNKIQQQFNVQIQKYTILQLQHNETKKLLNASNAQCNKFLKWKSDYTNKLTKYKYNLKQMETKYNLISAQYTKYKETRRYRYTELRKLWINKYQLACEKMNAVNMKHKHLQSEHEINNEKFIPLQTESKHYYTDTHDRKQNHQQQMKYGELHKTYLQNEMSWNLKHNLFQNRNNDIINKYTALYQYVQQYQLESAISIITKQFDDSNVKYDYNINQSQKNG